MKSSISIWPEKTFYFVFSVLVLLVCVGCYEKPPDPVIIVLNSSGSPIEMERSKDPNWCAAVCARRIGKFHTGQEIAHSQSDVMFYGDTDNSDRMTMPELALYLNNPLYVGLDMELHAEASLTGHINHAAGKLRADIPLVWGFWNTHMVIAHAYTYDTSMWYPIGMVFMDPGGNDNGWGDGYGLPAVHWQISRAELSGYVYPSNGYYRSTSNSTTTAKVTPEFAGVIKQNPDWFRDISITLYKDTPPGYGNGVDEFLPCDDGGGCPGCPPPGIDSLSQHYAERGFYHLITKTDTTILVCARPYYAGDVLVALPWRTVKQMPTGSAKLNAGLDGAVQPINCIVQPFGDMFGNEILAVVFTADISERYMETAFYPSYDMAGKMAPQATSQTDLVQMVLTMKWMLENDPGSVIMTRSARNIFSAETYYERGLLPEGWSAENIYDPDPDLELRRFWSLVQITNAEGEVVAIHDIWSRDHKYERDETGKLRPCYTNPDWRDTDTKSPTKQSGFLQQNYPNPFNAETQINFTLPTDGHVRLEVYNIVGQRVAILVDEYKSAGTHTVTWNADVASGIYFYRLQTNKAVETKKMVLMK